MNAFNTGRILRKKSPPFLADLLRRPLNDQGILFLHSLNSAAHMIFPAIQSVLFMPCEMTTMSIGHPSFFSADLVIPIMKVSCLVSADITISEFVIDSSVLII